jgi:hypothetical protein
MAFEQNKSSLNSTFYPNHKFFDVDIAILHVVARRLTPFDAGQQTTRSRHDHQRHAALLFQNLMATTLYVSPTHHSAFVFTSLSPCY